MGYVIVGTSDQGMHIVDPHDGSWAERTDGWPRSLSTTTAPALTTNNVTGVAAGGLKAGGSPFDPRTGGVIPTFWASFGDTDVVALIKYDGNVWTRTSVTGSADKVACDDLGNGWWSENGGSNNWVRTNSVSVATITADDFDIATIWDPDANATYSGPGGTYAAVGYGRQTLLGASSNGLAFFVGAGSLDFPGSASGSNASAIVTNAYTTGFMGQYTKLAALANSATADRSGNSNTLTENGTVTEAAVETGAELMGYSGFTANTNYLSRANDTDFEPGSGVAFVGLIWLKVNGVNDGSFDRVVEYQSTSPADGWSLDINNGGSLQSSFAEGGGSVSKASSATGFDDNAWHLAAFGRTTEGRAFISVDGLPREFSSSTDTDNMANASATLRIGEQVDGTNTLVNGTVALFRFAKVSISDDQIRKIYEAEKGMFAANAKCLLQGASDAVLDARIDPLTGKYIVTQSDTQDIFDGLTIETERTIAAGGTTFEHGLLWNDGVAEINDANLYASMPATDQRQVNEMVRSMAAELPAGVDLSKAKAWVVADGASGSVWTTKAGLNVESGARSGVGNYTVTWAIPFKSADYSVLAFTDLFSVTYNGTQTASTFPFLTRNTTPAAADSSRIFLVAFGELESE
jgi:hypothetical protein